MKKQKKTIENIVWILPRPRRKNKYKGGFPAHFEKKLFELYGWPKKILQPFGSMVEYGDRLDINPAWDAAWDATRSAAWDATRSAAWDATRGATRDATRGATRDATRGATRDAVRDMDWDMDWDAAWDATRDAAWDVARSAIWDVAILGD